MIRSKKVGSVCREKVGSLSRDLRGSVSRGQVGSVCAEFPVNNVRNAQLIFVSHNTNFLSKNIFRRDQVLLAGKDSFGSSSFTSLAQRKVRGDEAYEKNYLQGEYEAIPNIDSKFNLFESGS